MELPRLKDGRSALSLLRLLHLFGDHGPAVAHLEGDDVGSSFDAGALDLSQLRGAGVGERTESWYSSAPSGPSRISTTPPPGRSNAPAAPADCWMDGHTQSRRWVMKSVRRRGSGGQAAPLGAPPRPRCAQCWRFTGIAPQNNQTLSDQNNQTVVRFTTRVGATPGKTRAYLQKSRYTREIPGSASMPRAPYSQGPCANCGSHRLLKYAHRTICARYKC